MAGRVGELLKLLVHAAHLRLAVHQRPFNQLPLRDVQADSGQSHWLAVLIVESLPAAFHPPEPSLCCVEPELYLVVRMLRNRSADYIRDARLIFRMYEREERFLR